MTNILPFKYSDLITLESDINSKYKNINYKNLSKNIKKNIIHIGQLKLFINELIFLSTYYKENAIVIYVGAGPGGHIPLLAQMFLKLKFILYDPRDFDIISDKQIKVKQKLFTDEIAQKIKIKYKDKDILFISDIRSMDEFNDQFKKFTSNKYDNWELNVDDNMKSQMKWCQIINPIAASLKFRVLYNKPTYKYLTGTIHLQVFNKLSIETRLFTQDYFTTTIYNQDNYEKYNLFYNNEYRNITKKYNHFKNELKKMNLKPIFDSTICCLIIQQYYELFKIKYNKQDCVNMFVKIINEINNIYHHNSYSLLFIN